jgi:hypothetical protein
MFSLALFRRVSPLATPTFKSLSTVSKKSESVIVEASKMNIDQSPWKMNFLVKLVYIHLENVVYNVILINLTQRFVPTILRFVALGFQMHWLS